jgi:hypothetical protein
MIADRDAARGSRFPWLTGQKAANATLVNEFNEQ